MAESSLTRSRKGVTTTTAVLGTLAVLAILGVAGVALASGGTKKGGSPPPNNGGETPPPNNGGGTPPPDNGGGTPPPPPPADPPPDNGELVFDLENNWGGIPMQLREWLARAEIASGIPGSARALAVKAWQAYRAKQPLVTPAEAAAIAAANPDLCLKCENFKAMEGMASKSGIDKNIAPPNKWPKPVDYDNWIRGSAGLFDILGSSFVFAGIHTNKNYLPFVSAPNALAVWKSYEGQIGAAIWIIYRILNGPYLVLDPGVNATPETQNPRSTWGNVFSAYANPSAFQQQTNYAKQAKADYQARADEIGIDLSKVAYPWPSASGTNYKNWKFETFYKKLLSIKDAPIKNLPAVAPVVYIPNPAPKPPALPQAVAKVKSESFEVGDVGVRLMTSAPDSASLPLVVVLHDSGATDVQLFSEFYTEVRLPLARYALLRGPVKVPNSQRAWFDVAANDTPDTIAAKIESVSNQLEDQVLPGIIAGAPWEIQQNISSIYVIGFGQGGAVAYRLGAKGVAFKVLGIAGALPPSLYPTSATPSLIWGVHGTNDTTVPFVDGQATVASFDGKILTQGPNGAVQVPPVFIPVDGGFHSIGSLRPGINAALAQILGG